MTEIFRVIDKYPAITGENAEEFRNDLLHLESEIQEDLLIDFEDIDQISSIGISALFSTYQNLLDSGKKMSVINACEKNKRLFEMMNMSKIIVET